MILITSNLCLFAVATLLVVAGFSPTVRAQLVTRCALYIFLLGTLSLTLTVANGQLASGMLLSMAIAWLGVVAGFFFNIRAIISFLAPLVTIILLGESLFGSWATSSSLTSGGLLSSVHILLAICGEAFAIGACGLAILYLWQRHILKNKLLQWLGLEIPALDRIGSYLGYSLWLGFIFLTIGLLTGALYSRWQARPLDGELQLKIVWALAVWGWYLVILVRKNVFNGSARSIARMSLGGFVLLAVSFFGLLFFKPSLGI